MPTEASSANILPTPSSEDGLANHFELVRPYLLAIARREFAPRINDGCGGSDLVQETFLAAFRQWKQFRGSSPKELMAWLRAILRYKILRQRRKRRNALTSSDVISIWEPLPHDLPDHSPSPALQVEKREEQLVILQLLLKVPELQRLIVEARLERDQTYAEIGKHLGMTADAVRMAYGRTVQLLRSLFLPEISR